MTRNNFGCGSSREHAVWALAQDGYQVIIAPWKEINGERLQGFADIFRSNAVKNGLLTIELSEPEVDTIFDLVQRHPGLEATADLPSQTVRSMIPTGMYSNSPSTPESKKNFCKDWTISRKPSPTRRTSTVLKRPGQPGLRCLHNGA